MLRDGLSALSSMRDVEGAQLSYDLSTRSSPVSLGRVSIGRVSPQGFVDAAADKNALAMFLRPMSPVNSAAVQSADLRRPSGIEHATIPSALPQFGDGIFDFGSFGVPEDEIEIPISAAESVRSEAASAPSSFPPPNTEGKGRRTLTEELLGL